MSDHSTRTKTCSKCGLVADPTQFVSGKSCCKPCNNARRRAAYALLSEAERQSLLQQNREWRSAHRDETREQKREYGRRNRERDAGRQKAWRERNAEHLSACKRAYHLANAEKIRERARLWKLTHRAEATANNARRRARLKGAAGWGYTTNQHVAWRWEMWGGRCWICNSAAEATDHVLPLNDGGPHWPANLRPICTSCNSSRKKKRHHA